jgi:hypothetical protein
MRDSMIWLVSGLLSLIALVISYFIGSEVVRIIREFMQQMSTPRPSIPAPEATPLPAAQPPKPGTRSRATIERMITQLKEDRPPQNE